MGCSLLQLVFYYQHEYISITVILISQSVVVHQHEIYLKIINQKSAKNKPQVLFEIFREIFKIWYLGWKSPLLYPRFLYLEWESPPLYNRALHLEWEFPPLYNRLWKTIYPQFTCLLSHFRQALPRAKTTGFPELYLVPDSKLSYWRILTYWDPRSLIVLSSRRAFCGLPPIWSPQLVPRHFKTRSMNDFRISLVETLAGL